MHLTKKGAQILWQSFRMETPDVSLVFEMSFSGLSDPADATITADWTKLQELADVQLGGDVGYLGIGVGFDYGNYWESARDNGAISIDYKGDPDKLQTIIERAYARLHDLMFEPIPVNEAEAPADSDPMSAFGPITQAVGESASSYASPWQARLTGGYKRRQITREGVYRLDFRQRSRTTLTTAMAGNVGGLYQQYGDDESVFRTINIGVAPEFRVREISVGLDARDESEFSKYINHVTLSLRKKHGSGAETPGQLTIARRNYESGRPQTLRYGWKKEPSVEDWLAYEYRTDWSFVGGARFESDWVETDSAAIALTPPYQYREVEFIASQDILEEKDVRMVSIRVTHDFFGREVQETINLLPSRQQYSASRVFAVPPDSDSISYTITWTLNDRSKLSTGPIESDATVIFCDELPSRT
jgi:hypothetical protein